MQTWMIQETILSHSPTNHLLVTVVVWPINTSFIASGLTSWANKMDTHDPFLGNDDPATATGVYPVITIVSLMDCTN